MSYSQTSRDRLVLNALIALPVIALLLVIRRAQSGSGAGGRGGDGGGGLVLLRALGVS